MAGRPSLVLIIMLVCQVLSARSETGVYFVPQNEVYLSHSTWLVTLSYDLAPYKQHLNALKDEITRFHNAFKELDKQGSSKFEQNNKLRPQVLYLMERATIQFYSEYAKVEETLLGLDYLVSHANDGRRKRALIPIIGSLLSKVFGLSSEEDLNQLRDLIGNLADSQSQMAHVVKDSLSIINKTHEAVKMDRSVINNLIQVTDGLAEELGALYDDTVRIIRPELSYVQIASWVHDIFHYVSSAMRETHFALLDLNDQVMQSLHGTLSTSMVQPKKLAEILKSVQQSLPEGLTLPYDIIPNKMFKFYQELYTLMVPDQSGFHILTAVPIVHQGSRYDIYKVLAVPVPQVNMSLDASYDLESSYLSVSHDLSNYALLTENHAALCSHSAFCKLRSPLYDAEKTPNCIMSHKLKDGVQIAKYCKKLLKTRHPSPRAYFLFRGRWVVSAPIGFTLYVKCYGLEYKERQPEPLTIPIGVTIITLNKGCSAVSDYFVLPVYIDGGTSVEVERRFDDELRLGKLLPDVWSFEDGGIRASLKGNFSSLMLDGLSDLPLGHLHGLLDQIMTNDQTVKFRAHQSKTTTNWYIVVGVIMICILGLSAGAVFLYRRAIKTRKYVPTAVELIRAKKPLIEMKEITNQDVKQQVDTGTSSRECADVTNGCRGDQLIMN